MPMRNRCLRMRRWSARCSGRGPARRSSIEGEVEHSFSHILTRDIAYQQLPRASRAARHTAAAAWLERKAGERVEDVADVLAHHYLAALELSRAARPAEQADELE